MSWARSMAARSVKNALLDGPDAATPKKIVRELNEGVSRAMLPLASRLDATGLVPCPDAGQGITGVSAPEAIELADYLRHALSTSEVQRIRELSEANARQIALNPRPGGMRAPCSLQGEDCVCKAY